MEVSVFLGAEGCSEVEGKPWIRNGTHEEYEELRTAVGNDRWNSLISDATGRPFFLVFISDEAPAPVWEKANMIAKMKRLYE